MQGKKKIVNIIEDYFAGSGKYLVDIKITPQNKVMVYIDGDKGVTISDCADLSKHIEKFFDRDVEDFELEVSSAGVGKPLMITRQYLKNIGRKIAILTHDNQKIVGKLLSVDEENNGLEIEIIDKNASKKKKSKQDQESKNIFISFEDIKEAKIKAEF